MEVQTKITDFHGLDVLHLPRYYNTWNSNGQILRVVENGDIIVYYSFSNDTRKIKMNFPRFLQNDNIAIALCRSERMRLLVENKFNEKGFFICKKVGSTYEKNFFGKPFNFEYFIQSIKNKEIVFNSGMYFGNSRNYSKFKASWFFWKRLITEEYS